MIEKMKGFPPCRVINLRECEDRRQYMQTEFARLGITDYQIDQYERFEKGDIDVIGEPDVLDTIDLGPTTSHLMTIKKWYEETDDEMVAIFEDDCDFGVIDLWPFKFQELLDRMGPLWDGISLCVMHEGWPVMYPRHRNGFDHGLQCYIIKRHYAKKIIDWYFYDKRTVHFKMPYITRQAAPKDGPRSGDFKKWPATIENVVFGLGYFYIYPIFNHAIHKFPTTTEHCDANGDYENVAERSYDYIYEWWRKKGQHATLDQLFDYDWCCSGNQTFNNVMPID